MVRSLMSIAREFAGNGKLNVGDCLRRVTKAGTEIKIFNRGNGVMEQFMTKANGDTFQSLFSKTKGLIEMHAKNARGNYMIKPNVVLERSSTTGEPISIAKQLIGAVKGLKGEYKLNMDYNGCQATGVSKKLLDYLVKQDKNVTLNNLRACIFHHSPGSDTPLWRSLEELNWRFI